jgi:hypothetical protein
VTSPRRFLSPWSVEEQDACFVVRDHDGQQLAMASKAEKRSKRTDDLVVVDSSGLMDADWAAINKLRRTYQRGDSRALNSALKKLTADPIRYFTGYRSVLPGNDA